VSNYPAGVTGNEYQIAGADAEYTEERTVRCDNEECSQFEIEIDAEVDIQSYHYEEWWSWTCPECKTSADYEGAVREFEQEYEPELD
jgi:hypothetical protein